jgi:hypothetical protein
VGRVLALRTLSKAFGLAGLRVGYGVGHPGVVRAVERARGPFKVTYPAERAPWRLADTRRLGWVRAHARLAWRSATGSWRGSAPSASTRAGRRALRRSSRAGRGRRGRAPARGGVAVRVFAGCPRRCRRWRRAAVRRCG